MNCMGSEEEQDELAPEGGDLCVDECECMSVCVCMSVRTGTCMSVCTRDMSVCFPLCSSPLDSLLYFGQILLSDFTVQGQRRSSVFARNGLCVFCFTALHSTPHPNMGTLNHWTFIKGYIRTSGLQVSSRTNMFLKLTTDDFEA